MSLEKTHKFEVQDVHQIWRTKECTFNVSFPTKQLVCVFAMRGQFTRLDYKALNNLFLDAGYKQVIFEREVDGQLEQKVKTIHKRHEDIVATTFKRLK
ncbi:hypothetical protein [Alteromonas sp. BMJM2]|uniref:hypothetical protein n=1 Tax=Alteromonas sp. BMJM2 TaxID=2954241 RepID=UPI0022B4D63F|nr:hypothetical protein [Alteromonas sp. BMJM2]